jgi:PAS domain S-box-containing protein
MSQDSSAPHQGEAGQPPPQAHAPAAPAPATAAPHQLAFLAEASRVLAESLEYTTTLDRVARLAVPFLADWCVIELLDDDGGSRRVAVAHVDPAKEALSRDVRRRYPQAQQAPASLAARVVRTGQSVVMHDISVAHLQDVAQDAEHLQLLLVLGPKADMCLPLIAHGHLLGTISFRLVQTARRYTAEDLLLAEELARRAALAVDNARVHSELRLSQERLRVVLDTIPDAVCWKDRHGVYLGCNAVFASTMGLSPAAVVGKTGAELPSFPREDAERRRQGDQRVMERNHPEHRLIEQLHRPDGSVAWVETTKVPLHDAHGQVIGVLDTAHDVTERKRAEEALAVRIEQIEAVRTIAAELTQELSLPTLLDLILRRAVECVDAATEDVILLWDAAAQVLIPQAWRGYGAWEAQLRAVRLQLGESLCGTVAQRRQGLIVNDYPQSRYVHPQTLMAHLGYTAAMAEPLLYRDRLVGVIMLTNGATQQHFTERDRELLTLLAAHATIAIENARLFAESTRRQAWLASILDINKRIATSADRDHLMARIAEEATHLLGADGALVRVCQADQVVATPHICYGTELSAMMDGGLGDVLASRAIREDRAIVSPDLQADPTIRAVQKEQAAAEGLHAILTIPIRGNRGIVGTLQVMSRRPRPFAPDEVAALSAYAEQAAMAIENARLLAAEAERTRALERTNTTLHHEITERQRVEAEREQLMAVLEARHTEMERFTYMVSHDLKSPLITIQGFVALLEQDVMGGDRERMQTDMRYIQVAAATMQRLLDELLELSRIGHVANPLTEVPLSELAREAVTLVGGQLVARGVQVHITPHLPVVRGDRPRLLAVLQNLLDNAIKFMGAQPAPQIEIGARQEGEQTICYIHDNGVGIEPRYHEKVFGLFERLDVSSGGTGMGLALVKRILEVHGGRIWVESAGQGHGSTFCFTLPLRGEGTQRTS